MLYACVDSSIKRTSIQVDSRRFRSIQIHSGLFDCFTSYSRPRNLWKMQICMRRFSATTPALYNTKRGRGLRRSSRSLRSCVGKEPSLEIYWATSRNLLSVCSVTLPDLVNISPPQLPHRLYSLWGNWVDWCWRLVGRLVGRSVCLSVLNMI